MDKTSLIFLVMELYLFTTVFNRLHISEFSLFNIHDDVLLRSNNFETHVQWVYFITTRAKNIKGLNKNMLKRFPKQSDEIIVKLSVSK